MKGKTRNIYPGGNTPKGFYSYYNYILPQRKAEKIFCIKGGPGVGKSTLMKEIGDYFVQKGEDLDLLWCSSDPDSLDGILLRERGVAIVDGTAPHVTDPKNPGAVDEIIDLGRFWKEGRLREQREQIIRCNEEIGETFACAYGYLRCAEAQYNFMAQILDRTIPGKELRALRRKLQEKLSAAAGGEQIGEVRKAFAGAITPSGIKNELSSIIQSAEEVIVIESPVGFRTGALLEPASGWLTDAGLDVEKYYCPMDPANGLEHIFCPQAGMAVITENDRHQLEDALEGKRITRLRIDGHTESSTAYGALLEDLRKGSGENITKALICLKEAKALHDKLERFYIPNMDFKGIEMVKHRMIETIEELAVK